MTRKLKVVDFQRSAVYSWEAEEIRPHYPTGIPIEAISLVLSRASEVTGHKIEWEVNPRATRWAWGGSHITLPNPQKARWAYSVPVALHEAAHVVLQNINMTDAHGPRFVGLFLQLLRTCGGSRGKAHVGSWAQRAVERGIQLENMRSLVEHCVPAAATYGLDGSNSNGQ